MRMPPICLCLHLIQTLTEDLPTSIFATRFLQGSHITFRLLGSMHLQAQFYATGLSRISFRFVQPPRLISMMRIFSFSTVVSIQMFDLISSPEIHFTCMV